MERGEIEGSQTATVEQPMKRMNEKGFDRETRRKREREKIKREREREGGIKD